MNLKKLRQDHLQLLEEARSILNLTEPRYTAREVAARLHISVPRLYDYLNDPELEIDSYTQGKSRTRYVASEDVAYIWAMREGFYNNGPRPRKKRPPKEIIRPVGQNLFIA